MTNKLQNLHKLLRKTTIAFLRAILRIGKILTPEKFRPVYDFFQFLFKVEKFKPLWACLLYTSDAADE